MNGRNLALAARPVAAPAVGSSEKTDIIMALREVARGMEQGNPDILALMQVLGTELLVLPNSVT